MEDIKKMICKSMKVRQVLSFKMKMRHRYSISLLKVFYLLIKTLCHLCNGGL